MKCKNCGGNLIYENGYYTCESCQTKFSVTDYYDNTEVFLLYTEIDQNGRRSKSSIIAQDISRKIKNDRINLFFARESISDLLGSDFEKVYRAALHSSKVVIVVGTSKVEFDQLLEQYGAFLDAKIVFPVYADMDAYEIPTELKTIQSLSYEKIAWQADLEKALVKALGKDDNYDFAEKNIKSLSKKTKTKVIVLSTVSFLLIVSSIIIIFFTPLVLTSKKYEYAQNQYENGNYAKAISTFSEIRDYKNSKKSLYNILQRYNGYYHNKKHNTTVHLVISNTLKADIEIVKTTESFQVKITESFQISSVNSDFSFNDSGNNNGSGTIEFYDDGFILSIQTEEKNSDIAFNDSQMRFFISKKSDKSFAKIPDANMLLSFLSTKTTLEDLKQKGYNIELSSTQYNSGANGSATYRIKDTDIYLALFSYDISFWGLDWLYYEDNEYGNMDEYMNDHKVNDPIVFGISAPAQLLIPEYVGKSNNAFVKDDILYVPNGELNPNVYIMEFNVKGENKTKTIDNNTQVGFVSKAELSNENFEQLVQKYNASNNDLPNIDEKSNLNNNSEIKNDNQKGKKSKYSSFIGIWHNDQTQNSITIENVTDNEITFTWFLFRLGGIDNNTTIPFKDGKGIFYYQFYDDKNYDGKQTEDEKHIRKATIELTDNGVNVTVKDVDQIDGNYVLLDDYDFCRADCCEPGIYTHTNKQS